MGKCILFSASFLGVIPSTDFLKSSGVPLSSRGDVIVDKVRVWFDAYLKVIITTTTIVVVVVVAFRDLLA